MTLKEFSTEYLQPRDAVFGEKPHWRKAFPTNLRFREVTVVPGHYKGLIFRRYVEPKYKYELQEEWERLHNGEIIDREWRKVYTY